MAGPAIPWLVFAQPAAVVEWRCLHDTVMGGRSSGTVAWLPPGLLRFEGVVSLEDGGGFASARSGRLEAPAPGTVALVTRVRGDGRRYKLALRTMDAFDAAVYQAEFATPPGAFVEPVLPLADFVPRRRGRDVTAPPLRPQDIASLGWVIADRQAGPFRLDVESVALIAGP